MNKQHLENISKELRKDIIEMIYESGSGHPGGSLSIIDVVTYLYFEKMNIDPKNPKLEGRDRFILSKGHAAPAQYSALAKRGFFEREELKNLRKLGSFLQGHPDAKKCPGVEISTGSLGQGFSNSCGLALASKMDNKSEKVYVVLGDGEIQEGIVWETAMAAAKFKLDNLVAIVDKNGIQLDGRTSEIMDVDPLADRWKSFGWNVIECDGHNFDEIDEAFNKAGQVKGKPTVIIAHTIKGKGVSFMEDNVAWHGMAPSKEQKEQAVIELSK
ncbi:transketolase [Clostridium botulinum]|uniref:Transketolase n=1 Tax=Clostridium botulinum TaxID=1491 RepID=A0A6B4PFE6_CLOBO|nr:transketolase [Clostridium botulinum]EES50474.1 transketolase [Clostridium botulinum E1 str. 'BoNT E Beluga']MBN1050196.1 transketolase [Clostridium botulinum]MBY6762763.1 transketolase [Clostridium botulinum]MBY6921548.1 transketolase [Clostridium botulinum]MCR1132442.1 transketolase [Clostridium botulinum]